MKGRGGVQISTETFNAIEEYIRWCYSVPSHMPVAMDILARMMALTNQGIAQEMSFGPLDPTGRRNASQAWKIPVRRISGHYLYGWRVRRISAATWMLYNDSREAYFIEFGIHRQPGSGEVSARRVRRPVRKLSLRRTLEAMMRTQAYHRVWAEIFVDKRHGAGRGFVQTVQAPRMGSFTGPRLGARLPG